MRKVQAALAFAVFGLVSGPVETHADILTTPDSNGGNRITVHGLIQRNDVYQLEALIRTNRPAGIVLNSTGGDVMAAMELGRLLRHEKLTVFLFSNDTCVSACVFVLAGAPTRIVFGTVGIHRPFLSGDVATTEEQQKRQYQQIERLVKNYLAEMNVDSQLYDDMFRVSSLKVKYLTEDEREAYGLGQDDPYMEQAYLAGRAKKLGISLQELLRRRGEANATCNSDGLDCYLSIELGVSRTEYLRREVLADKVCPSYPKGEQDSCYFDIIDGLKR